MALSPKRSHRKPHGIDGRDRKPDLCIIEIAGGILCPRVTGELQGTDARITAAHGLIGAHAATSLQGARPGSQRGQQWIGLVIPDPAEGAVAHTIDFVV